MNEKGPNQNDDNKKGEKRDDFVFNISTESNSNPNVENVSLKQTGAIPKVKSVVNGVPERKTKLNNCNSVTKRVKSSLNGFCDNGETSNASSCDVDQQVRPHCFSSETMGLPITNGGVSNSGETLDSPFCDGAGPSSQSFDKNSDECLSSSPVSESDFSSDTGNDELSYCDDYCIYTYKGDIADLPRSFMNLDQDNNENGSQAGSRGSSPEMDFLEMDFDPGPSNDIESDNSSLNIDLEGLHEEENSNNFNRIDVKGSDYDKKGLDSKNENLNPKNENTALNTLDSDKKEPLSLQKEALKSNNNSLESNGAIVTQVSKIPFSKSEDFIKNISKEPQPCCSKSESNIFTPENLNKTIQNDLSQLKLAYKSNEHNLNSSKLRLSLCNDPWIPKNPSLRTKSAVLTLDNLKNHHSSGGDLILFNENIIASSSDLNYKGDIEKTLFLEKHNQNVEPLIERTMIWTEQEAALNQTTQIGTSACAATAVINVLKALEYEVPPNEKVLECVQTRLRANNSPLLKYLQSRSVAGSTHEDIILGLQELSNNQIYSRFFHCYPERYINLSLWLSHWIKLGAVPIATLNLQKTIGNGIISDAWHHQMIFGVGPNGIYLTNPLERVNEGVLFHQLTSDSELLIRREDVISRFDFRSLKEMMGLQDVRWKRLNVVGQVANVVREHRLKCKIFSRTHVNIPASYKAGITLAIDVTNPACEILQTCPDLPVYYTTV